MIRSIFCLLFLVGSIFDGHAQSLKAGPSFGNYWQSQIGQGLVDSVALSLQSGRDNIAVWGVHGRYDFTPWYSIQASVRGWNNVLALLLENEQEECFGCPNLHAVFVGYTTGQFSLASMVSLPIGENASVGVFGGGNLNAHITRFERWNPTGQVNSQVRTLVNQLPDNVRPITFGYTYGISLDVWRLSLQGQLSGTMGDSLLHPIIFDGVNYTFLSQIQSIQVNLVYLFDIPNSWE